VEAIWLGWESNRLVVIAEEEEEDDDK